MPGRSSLSSVQAYLVDLECAQREQISYQPSRPATSKKEVRVEASISNRDDCSRYILVDPRCLQRRFMNR